MSTLCAGCGTTRSRRRHRGDLGAVASARAAREALRHRLLVEDHRLLRERRPRLQRRARAACPQWPPARTPANKSLHYIGVSGDGDSLSIGFGQFAHAIRRNVNISTSARTTGCTAHQGAVLRLADIGTKSKKARRTKQAPVTPASAGAGRSAAASSRAAFPATGSSSCRSSRPLMHKGFALIVHHLSLRDLQHQRGGDQSYRPSPASTTHEGSARRPHPARRRYRSYARATCAVQMPRRQRMLLRKLDRDYDPTHLRRPSSNCARACARADTHGVIFVSEAPPTCTTWPTP